MKPRAALALLSAVMCIRTTTARADMPYPLNPQPCSGTSTPACIPATDFSRYLFLPATTPLTLPNDFGTDNWKLTSSTTGDPTIDGNPQELFGIKGASVDLAWQVTTGRPDVLIAVLDSGIRWQDRLPDLVNKIYLNRGELPVPEGSTNTADPWDRNGDGVFNIQDYLGDANHAQDSRVSDQNGNGTIDPEDLIFLFSDGTDQDHNGYVDDIAGWDFFEDDNDPLDEVGYGHGTGEAEDSNAEAHNGIGDVGTCPSCMVMPVRVGDSFVAEVNNFAQGVLFATDSGARVVQEALGTLNNSSFAQTAVDYAYQRGVIVVASAADEESNHHNYPANYNHTLEVNSVTKFTDTAGIQQTPHSYLYLNGCTNFGGHIGIAVSSSSCSSEATGKSSGMAGLVISAALNEIDRGHLTPYPKPDGTAGSFPLSANEVKQLLTMTADDINFDARPDPTPPLPQNYETTSPFPGVQMSERFHSIAGWDQYFGYGRVNANAAVRRVSAGKIPPEAELWTPDWFQVVSPDAGVLTIAGRVAAARAASYTYTIEVAAGIQPAESSFFLVASDHGTSPREGRFVDISLQTLTGLMPHGVDGAAIDEHGLPDPDRFTVTVRLRVVDILGNRGEDRRVFAFHRDPDLVGGQPRRIGSDGAASPVLADLDGNGVEDVIVATSDGEVHAYDGGTLSELPGWPVHTDPIEVHSESPAFRSGAVPRMPFGAILGVPAVGDLDRDGKLEVVAADVDGKLYVWDHTGHLRPGFPVSTIAAYSFTRLSERDPSTPEGRVPDRTNRHDRNNRLGRGFGAGPALGNLDGSADGSLEIIIGALDRHVYAWHADGSPVRGWPVLVKDPTKVLSIDPITNEVTLKADAKADIGTKIITSVALGDLDGDHALDVVTGVNEEYDERPNAVFNNLIIGVLRAAHALNSGNGRTYAIFHDGTAHGAAPIDHGWNPDAFMPGWPVKVAMLTRALLPTVGTGINGTPALADLDGDGRPEIGVFSFLGPVYIFNGAGGSFLGLQGGMPRTLEPDTFGAQSNSTDAPSYPSLGGGVFAPMAGAGGGFQFVAPGAGLGKLLDAGLAAHQTPADNHLSVWDVANSDGTPATGQFRAAFPRVVNDLQFFTSPMVADIDGDGLPEAFTGSGVYDLHAFNINGAEPCGWPKFTGGWTVTTPAVGDIDGDGRLEVVGITREGYLFIWRTVAGECSAMPWRKRGHDEWNTNNYATDARPPAAVAPRTAELRSSAGNMITLALGAVPGNDLFCGAPAQFDVRYASQPIENEAQFAAATRFEIVAAPSQSGRHTSGEIRLRAASQETGPVYVALRTADGAGNQSALTAIGQTTLEPPPTPTLCQCTPMVSPTATSPPTATPVASRHGDGCMIEARASHGTAVWIAVLAIVITAAQRVSGARARRREALPTENCA